MRNFRIETRLAIGFAIVIAFATACGGFAWLQAGKIDDTSGQQLTRLGWQAAHTSEDLRNSLQKQYVLFERMLNTSDRLELDKLDSEIANERSRSTDLFTRLDALPSSEKQQNALNSLKSARDRYGVLFVAAVGMGRMGTDEAKKQLLDIDTQNLQPEYAKYMAQADALVAVARKTAQEQDQPKEASAPISGDRILIFLAAGILLSTVVAVIIIRSIVEPISGALQVLDETSRGDLTRRVDVTSGDQLGGLLTALNVQLDSHCSAAETAERLAEGDFTVPVNPSSDRDVMGRAMAHIRNNMQTAVELAEKLAAGNLAIQPRVLSDKDKLGGALVKLSDVLRESSEAAKEISEGGSAPSLRPLSTGDILRHSLLHLRDRLQISTKLAFKLAEGNLAEDVPATKTTDPLARLLVKAQQNLSSKVAIIQKVSDGDLSVHATPSSDNDRLGHALEQMLESLRHTIGDVVTSASNISIVSADLISNASQLSQNSDQHAVATSEARSVISGLALSLNQSVENAQLAERLAVDLAKDGNLGGAAMGQTVEAARELAEKLILFEEITRRNDLLTLAAAVEGAKAGEHGTGFSIIAAELRKLGERSQTASSDILRLMAGSSKIAQTTSEILTKFIPGINQTADLARQGALVSAEQNIDVARAKKAIQQLDNVIQQNVFASRQVAATAEHLINETKALQSALGVLKVAGSPPEMDDSTTPFAVLQKSAAG